MVASSQPHKKGMPLLALFLTILLIIILGVVVSIPEPPASTIIFVCITSFLVLLVSTGLVLRINGMPWQVVTIPTFVFVAYTLQINVAGTALALTSIGAFDLQFWAAIQASTLLLAIGCALASLIFRFAPKENAAFLKRPVCMSCSRAQARPLLLIALPAYIGAVALYISRVGASNLPLLYMLSNPGDAREIALLREASFKVLDVAPLELYIYTWLRDLFLPLSLLLAYNAWYHKRSAANMLLLAVYAALTFSYVSLSTAKAPVASVVLAIVLLQYFLAGPRWIFKTMPAVAIAIFLFPFIETTMKYGRELSLNHASLTLTWVMFDRLFIVPATVLREYFVAFPLESGLLLGRSMRLVSWITERDFFNTANYVFGLMYPGTYLTTGLANAAFIGDAYADFGTAGVIFSSLSAGFIIQAMQVLVVRLHKTGVVLAVYSCLCVLMWGIVSTPITSILLSKGAMLAIVFASLSGLSRCKRRTNRPKHRAGVYSTD